MDFICKTMYTKSVRPFDSYSDGYTTIYFDGYELTPIENGIEKTDSKIVVSLIGFMLMRKNLYNINLAIKDCTKILENNNDEKSIEIIQKTLENSLDAQSRYIDILSAIDKGDRNDPKYKQIINVIGRDGYGV